MQSQLADCSNNRAEFWTHISGQSELPVADSNNLDDDPVESITSSLDEVATRYRNSNVSDFSDYLRDIIIDNPESIRHYRKLLSIPNKRLYLDLSYKFSRTKSPHGGDTLCGCPPHDLTRHQTSVFINKIKRFSRDKLTARKSAKVVADYLIEKGILEILDAYTSMGDEQREAVVRYLIAPGEAQQNEAKRRGHGPEAALARLLSKLGVSFLPSNKTNNPIGADDPRIDQQTFQVAQSSAGSTFSSDLVILSNGDVKACVVGLVHSSDPGQFGVDKSDTVVDIRQRMDAFNSNNQRDVEIWGLVGGVGYSENKNGTINKMLPEFHHFIQVKSLYKSALKLHHLGLCNIKAIQFDSDFYSSNTMSQMASKYVPQGVNIVSQGFSPSSSLSSIEAGKATLFI